MCSKWYGWQCWKVYRQDTVYVVDRWRESNILKIELQELQEDAVRAPRKIHKRDI